jgi:hypothetical protein
MIQELMDLDDLESGERHINAPPVPEQPKSESLARYIREPTRLQQQSGMQYRNEPVFHKDLTRESRTYQGVPAEHEMGHEMYNQPYPHQRPMEYYHKPGDPTCIDFANHVKDCPICSRFYNNDRTVYIIVIVVLTIVCLLLMKKVLEL